MIKMKYKWVFQNADGEVRECTSKPFTGLADAWVGSYRARTVQKGKPNPYWESALVDLGTHDYVVNDGTLVGVPKTSGEYTGKSSSYYKLKIDNPANLPEAYTAECLDIIEALDMNFSEGEAFKALWRRAAARKGSAKRGYDNGKYDAEKIAYYAGRILKQEEINNGQNQTDARRTRVYTGCDRRRHTES